MHASESTFTFQTLPITRGITQSTVPRTKNITKTKAKPRRALIMMLRHMNNIIPRRMEVTRDNTRRMTRDTRSSLGMKRSTQMLKNTPRRVAKIITTQMSIH